MSRTAVLDLARRMWHLAEPIHAVVYFAPEHRRAQDAAGLKGGWMAYFASRAAPLGPVPAEVVTALFYGFAPRMVARAIPDAWTFSSPEAVLAARSASVEAALARVLAGVDPAAVADAGDRLREVLGSCDVGGRPLYAANAALGWPEEPALRLWHGTTLLREHRGDGHVTALQAFDVDGCEAHLLAAAAGRTTGELLRAHRGWTDDEWQAAAERLRSRGLLGADAGMTAQGAELHAEVEELTDRLASPPWTAVDEPELRRLARCLEPVVAAVHRAGAVPYPNAMALPPTPGPTAGP